MSTIHICICHNNNLVVTQLGQIKFIADTAAESSNHGTDFCVGIDSIQASLFYVENLASDWQNSLETTIPSLLSRTTCRITLYDENLAMLWILNRAICQLTWQAAYLQGILTASQLSSLAGSLSGSGSHNSLVQNLLGNVRMFLKILIKALRNNGIYNASHLRVTQLGFGLALKLRLTNLQADNTGQALTNILTTEISLIILDNIILAGIIVPGSGQGNFKAC